MDSFPFALELGTWRPGTLFSGSFDGITNVGTDIVPNSPFVSIILGIDAYALQQPNNGEIRFTMVAPAGPIPAPVLPIFAQSTNFPGPYFWRGAIPIESRVTGLIASGSVPYAFNIWGVVGPDFQQFA